MRYIFTITEAYSYFNYITSNSTPIEFSVFSDIISNYIQKCIRRWWYGYDYSQQQEMVRVGLSVYLDDYNLDNYMVYLDNTFWPNINCCIDENISDNTEVFVTIKTRDSILLEVVQPPSERTRLSIVVDRVCVDVAHRLESGDYIDPTLMEIYNASRYDE